jgi:hypothetical protein
MAEPRRGALRMVEPEPIVSLDRDPLAGTLQRTEAQAPEPPEPAATESPPVQPAPEPESQSEPERQPEAQAQPEPKPPQTLSEMFALVDDGWRQFLRAAGAFPNERMDERLHDGWTRKQMLAHISAWHDLTHDRLGKLILTGESAAFTDNVDAFNARVARQAIGRTAGETLKEMEMTFNRLRRQLGRLTDEQLTADDGWAARVIAANTYDHYSEHRADVYQPPPPDGRSGRR